MVTDSTISLQKYDRISAAHVDSRIIISGLQEEENRLQPVGWRIGWLQGLNCSFC
jgi:hypothetical protein